MSRLRSIPYAVLLVGILVANGASAESLSRIEVRDAAQQERIHNGVRDGSLTTREAARLERGEARIERSEARVRADGVVTPAERRRIEHMQNRESRAIYEARHNARTSAHTSHN